jgi:haloacid dehalogenase-like hydrolase
MKARSSGSGGTMGTSNRGPGSVVIVPSEAKKTAICSWAASAIPATAGTLIRVRNSLEAWFDVVLVSCEVGLAKPDPAIYELCLSRLGVTARGALFVDDRIENLRRLDRHTDVPL